MTTPTNKRELILEYIRTVVLPRIDGDTIYHNSLNTITREFRIVDEFSKAELPAVLILDDYETSYSALTQFEYTTGTTHQSIRDGMNIGILAFISPQRKVGNDNEGSISTAINKMYSDILMAFYSTGDLNLGGNCLGFEFVKDRRMIQYKDKSQVGIILVNFAIKYDFSPQNKIV